MRIATGEGIVEGGELVPVEELLGPRMVGVGGAGSAPTVPDLILCGLKELLVRRVLPEHQILDDPEEALPLLLLGLLGGEEVGMG